MAGPRTSGECHIISDDSLTVLSRQQAYNGQVLYNPNPPLGPYHLQLQPILFLHVDPG